MTTWYSNSASTGQGLVIDEETGENIAVTYKAENAPIVAAAPDLLEALEKAEKLIAALNYAYYVTGTRKALDAVMGETKPTLKPIRAAIAKAKGE
jgi:hypothetical protein